MARGTPPEIRSDAHCRHSAPVVDLRCTRVSRVPTGNTKPVRLGAPSRHLRKLAMTDIPAKVDEALAAFRQHMRLNNMPIPDERFIRWVVGRILQIVQDQPDLPQDTKILAQVHAILIEDALQELRNAPTRPLLVTAMWAALSLGSTSSPGFSSEELSECTRPL